MLLLYIQLPAYQQLSKARPNLLLDIEKSIRNMMRECADELPAVPGAYYFNAGETPKQQTRSMHRAFDIYRLLGDRKHDLQGFLMGAICGNPGDLRVAATRIRSWLLRSPRDDQFWTNERTAKLIHDDFSTEAEGRYVRIVSPATEATTGDEGDTSGDIPAESMVSSQKQNAIHASIYRYLATGESSGVGITGGTAAVRRNIVEAVLDPLISGAISESVFIIDAGIPRATAYDALTAALRRLSRLCDTYTASDACKDSWYDVKRRTLNAIEPDPVDVRLAATHCLDTYMAYAKRENLTPFLVLLEYQYLDAESRELLGDLIDGRSPDELPFVVVTVAVSAELPSMNMTLKEVPCSAPGNTVIGDASTMTQSACDVFLIVYWSGGFLAFDNLAAFAREWGILENQFRHECEYLADHGMLFRDPVRSYRGNGRYQPNIECVDEVIAISGREHIDSMLRALCDYILSFFRERKIVPSLSFALLCASADHPGAMAMFAGVFRRMYERGYTRRLQEAMARVRDILPDTVSSEMLLDAFSARIGAAGFPIDLEDLPETDMFPKKTSDFLSFLEAIDSSARLLEAEEDPSRALSLSKNVIVALSGADNELGVRANLRIARIMAMRSRVDEAEAHCTFALESAVRIDDCIGELRAEIQLAVVRFLSGDIDSARCDAEAAIRRSLDCGAYHEQIHAYYLLSRIDFELGRYLDVAESCQTALALCELRSRNSPKSVFYKLMLRAAIHSGQCSGLPARIRALETSGDRAIIVSEYRFFTGAGDIDTPSTIESELAPGEAYGHTSSENEDDRLWKTMFGPIEDSARVNVSGRLAVAYNAMQHDSGSSAEDYRDKLTELVREEQMDPHDPYNAFYCLCSALNIRRRGGGEVERITALNRAVKYMQLRASRIDDAKLRREYLTANAYNAAIRRYAKEANLL